MRTRDVIPDDIWYHIARFIPDHFLRALLEVNGVFFNLAMDARYREITFENFDKGTMRMLQRLRKVFVAPVPGDPDVSKRVRSLKMSLWSPRFTVPMHYSGLPAPVSFQQEMTEAIKHLDNVREFSVECLDTPSPKDMIPVFKAAWDTFGSTLEKLSLAVDNLRTIFTTPFMSKCLNELCIEFTPGDYPEDDDTLAAILAPFINAHAASLQMLSIACSDSLRDLGPLYRSLGRFPKLCRLEIQVDFHKCAISDPRGLTRLFVDHSDTLTSVRLRPTVIRGTHWEAAEACLVEWMDANISDGQFLRDLQSLDLRMPVAAAHLDLTLSYLRRSRETLTCLSLLDHNLRYEQIEAVVKMLSPARRLRALSLQALTLSPQLIELLAAQLPYLQVLSLIVLNIHGCGGSLVHQNDKNSILEAVSFEEEMRKHLYPNWNLYDIGIFKVTQESCVSTLLAAPLPSIRCFLEPYKDPFTSRIVARSIPSIRCYFGGEDLSVSLGIGRTSK